MQLTEQQFRKAVAALRKHAIYRVTQPGMTGDKPIAFGCQECGQEWKPGEPESHVTGCPCEPLTPG